MEKSFGILHSDNQYAQDFAKALTRQWTNIAVTVLSSQKETERCDADYIITDDFILAEALKEKGIYLYDDPGEVQNHPAAIFRFQPIKLIVSQLMRCCAADLKNNLKYLSLREESDVKFIGVTSGSGGAGTSSLAVCIGRILSRLHNKSVLYVSFEACKPLSHVFSFNGNGHCVDKLLYKFASEQNVTFTDLESYLSEDSFALKCIGNMGNMNPLLITEEDDIYHFLYFLARCGMFDSIVLDVPCSFLHYTEIMKMCERQIVNFGYKKHCHYPSTILTKDLETCCSIGFGKTTDRIFQFAPLPDDASFISTEKGFDIDIHGQFGAEVRALVDSMEI